MKKILIVLALFFIASTAFAQVVVIANKSVTGSIDKATLKNIYSLDIKKVGGKDVVPFDLKEDNATRQKFYSGIGSVWSEMSKIWMRAKLSGAGAPPKQASSEDDMVAKVASTPGAIGFVSKSKVSGDVRIIMEIK